MPAAAGVCLCVVCVHVSIVRLIAAGSLGGSSTGVLSGFALTLMLLLVVWEVVVHVVGGLVLLLPAQNLPPAHPARPAADKVLLLLVACSPSLVSA